MRTIALLPMKLHSERVKNKNFRELNGKPLFSWILTSLLDCSVIDLVVINTDAREILEQFGIINNERILIRDRAEELRGDFVSMNAIINDDLSAVNGDRYLMTHTTNPLLSSNTIMSAIAEFDKKSSMSLCDSLFGVNLFQTRFYAKDGRPINHDPNNLIRTQDLEPWYEENSCIYIFTRQSFAATSARIGKHPIMFEVPKIESVDIDNRDDWFIASCIAKGLKDKTNYA